MSDDFRRGLEELTHEVAEGHSAWPGLALPAIARAARTRRRRHASLLAVGSAAALVLVAVTGSALVGRPVPAPAPPAQTSTATPTSAPTRPTPTPDPALVVPTLATKDHPSEPDAWVVSDEVWAAMGPGWALAVFSTVATLDNDVVDGGFDPAGTQALFLVAPDSTTYRLQSLPADRYGQIMWWDPVERTAWLFFQGLGESHDHVEVDLRDGSTTEGFLGSSSRDAAPVQQRTDGRTLWIDADPYFPTPVNGLYWQQTDGSFTQLAGPEIEGDVWLDPDGDRVVYLAETDDGLARTSIDLAAGSVDTSPLEAAPDDTACSILDVLDTSLIATCTSPEPPFGPTYYEVTSDGTWVEVAERPAGRLVHEMLLCGAPELPWSPARRVLPAHLAAQGWRDAVVVADAPGSGVPVPKKDSFCGG